MNHFFSHRILFLITMTLSFVSASMTVCAQASKINPTYVQNELVELEAASGGRIGLSAINTANNQRIKYRAEERFPLCSTAKVMCVSAILKQSMSDNSLLKQKINFKKEDLVVYSPMTEKHINTGMTVSELCAAALTLSDNTAMNLLLKKLGGPSMVNAFAHSIGDKSFSLNRGETELNSAIPGDIRDTTTPAAMEKSLQRLALNDTLAVSQREQLQTWLKNNTTGKSRIRAGVPKDWIVGDKTGTGEFGTTNDIGIIWPTKGSPIIIAIYFTQNKKDAIPRDDVIASVTRIVVSALS